LLYKEYALFFISKATRKYFAARLCPNLGRAWNFEPYHPILMHCPLPHNPLPPIKKFCIRLIPLSSLTHCAAGPRAIHTFRRDDANTCDVSVYGLALLNNQLYILYDTDENRVAVYSTIDFTFLRHISIPDTKNADLQDIVACSRKQCIYISECAPDGCVHRLGLDGSVCRWPVKCAASMSVMRNSNLLVVCDDGSGNGLGRLREISSENGDSVRKISPQLPADPNMYIRHGIQLSDNEYVICYFDGETTGISRIDNDGRILQSSDSQLRMAYYMAVDNDNFSFVADFVKNQILVFDPSLNFVCRVAESFIVWPSSLFYDDLTRRLYVGQGDKDDRCVVIIQL